MNNMKIISKQDLIEKLEKALGKDDDLVSFLREEMEKLDSGKKKKFSSEKFDSLFSRYSQDRKDIISDIIMEWIFGKVERKL